MGGYCWETEPRQSDRGGRFVRSNVCNDDPLSLINWLPNLNMKILDI